MLEYGLLGEAAIIVVTGEVGSGKTTLVRQFLDMVGPYVSVGLITSTHESLDSLLAWILLAFEVDTSSNEKIALFDVFARFLLQQKRNNRRTLLIVDEAQNLSPAVLEELRMLTNLNRDKELIFQIALVGQPELLNKLNRPDLRQLAQRVSVDYHLAPLNLVETCGYIRHRLRAAGGNPNLFTGRACCCIFLATEGLPRLINLLCDTSMVYAFGEGNSIIDLQTVLDVIEDRQRSGLAVFPALEHWTDVNSLKEEVANLLVSDSLPDNAARLSSANGPETEFQGGDRFREENHATPPLLLIESEKSRVKAIPLQAPHSCSALNSQHGDQQSAGTRAPVRRSRTKHRRFVDALSTVTLGSLFVVIGLIFWIIVTGRPPDQIVAFVTDVVSFDRWSHDKISSEAGSDNVGSEHPDRNAGFGQPGATRTQESIAMADHGDGGALASKDSDSGSEAVSALQGNKIGDAISGGPSMLSPVLAERREKATLEPALSVLFAQWGLSYNNLPGNSPCKKAHSRGLMCAEKTGDWSTVRTQDKPIIISLSTSEKKQPIYAAVIALDGEMATLDFGEDKRLRSKLDEIEPYWNGDYLVLNEPKITPRRNLRRGFKGEDVILLRLLLSRHFELDLGTSPLFDHELEKQVKTFQSKHGLKVDGFLGAKTLESLEKAVNAVSGPDLRGDPATGGN